MNWNEVADAGLLNPQPPVGQGLGFVPLSAVKRQRPNPASWLDGLTHEALDYQLTRANIRGRTCWWMLTGEGDILHPSVDWCGRGRDPRPWWMRLRAWFQQRSHYPVLAFLFGLTRRPW